MAIVRERTPDSIQIPAGTDPTDPSYLGTLERQLTEATELYSQIVTAYESRDYVELEHLVIRFFTQHPVEPLVYPGEEPSLLVSNEVDSYHATIIDLSVKIHSLLAAQAAYPTQGSLSSDSDRRIESTYHIETASRLGKLASERMDDWIEQNSQLLAQLQEADGYGPLVDTANNEAQTAAAKRTAYLEHEIQDDLGSRNLIKY